MSRKKRTMVGKVIPGNDPVHVKNTTVPPYCYVGLLQMTFPNGEEYIGTATLITEPGKTESSYAVTCAHNLYDSSDGGEVVKVTFTRAYSDPKTPYPEVEVTEWHYPAQYPDAAIPRTVDPGVLTDVQLAEVLEFDYGLVKLAKPVQLASLPVLKTESDETLRGLPVQINGYGIFNEEMSHATGDIQVVTQTSLQYPITTVQGASGSAIMLDDNITIVGIHTQFVDGEDLNEGVRITDTVKKQIEAWMAE